MRQLLVEIITSFLLGPLYGGCSIEDAREPITGQVSVSVPRMHAPLGFSSATEFDPVIELATVEHYPTLCYRIQYSKNERAGGRVQIAIGDAVSAADACADALGPANSSVSIDSTATRFRVIFTLRDSADTYDITIEPDRIRLTPIDLHFTFPTDSVWLR